MEAAPKDLPNPLYGVRENINRSGCQERVVGKGKENTNAIMVEAVKVGGGFGWAAQGCTALTVNGFNDWFLPSRDELNWMYGNLHMQGLGDFKNEWYYSSTAYSGDNGTYFYCVSFFDGRHIDARDQNRVRPIRQF